MNTPVETNHEVILKVKLEHLQLGRAVEDFEKCYLTKVLMLNRGKKCNTARMLGINRKTLYTKLKKYHML